MSWFRSRVRAGRTKGFVLVTMVLSTVVALACVGLAVDTGYLQLTKSRMQTAADAAALGGVQEIRQSGRTHVVEAARADAAANGFTDGVNSVAVSVNNPPATGYYTTDWTAVEALITQTVRPLFMSVLGFTSIRVRARSVARQGPGTNCLYTLERTGNNSFQASGGARVVVNCGVIVDSSSNLALNASGGASVTATSVSVAGGYQVSGGASVTPTPVTHVSPENDPLSYLNPPAYGGCWQTNWSASGGAIKSLSEGVYCGGIDISGGARVTMSPGTYILLGGGLKVSGGATLSGTGVTFFNTAGAGHPYGAVNLSGGTNVTLSAPTSGATAGILFYQDPAVGNGPPSTFSGGTTATLTGALYFPTTDLNYSGGAGGAYTIIVAKSVSFSGGVTMNSDYSSLPGGSPVKGSAALAE
jgi:Flp pilus assembly protein TadG